MRRFCMYWNTKTMQWENIFKWFCWNGVTIDEKTTIHVIQVIETSADEKKTELCDGRKRSNENVSTILISLPPFLTHAYIFRYVLCQMKRTANLARWLKVHEHIRTKSFAAIREKKKTENKYQIGFVGSSVVVTADGRFNRFEGIFRIKPIKNVTLIVARWSE